MKHPDGQLEQAKLEITVQTLFVYWKSTNKGQKETLAPWCSIFFPSSSTLGKGQVDAVQMTKRVSGPCPDIPNKRLLASYKLVNWKAGPQVQK